MKRFIVRFNRFCRNGIEYAMNEPWYMFVLGLLIGMTLIAVTDLQEIKHLRNLTTSLAEQRVVEHPLVAAPVAVEQPTKTEVCVERLLDGIVDPMIKLPAETEPAISAPTSDEVEAPHAAYWRRFIIARAANGW